MPYTSDSWTFGHVPTTFKRLPTVNRWGVLHGFYSDQRDDQELSNSAPDMPSGVGFRILANRSIWRFPNIPGTINFKRANDGDAWGTGCFSTKIQTSTAWAWTNNGTTHEGAIVTFDPSTVSSLYQNGLNEVRVNGLFGMMLIRGF